MTSTAAGPAFEGAGISCSCGSVNGAIDRVWTENGKVYAHTIADSPTVGICGSGLIDAVAAFLKTGQVDETGANESDTLPLRDGIALLPQNIRAIQLAKAAIAAGIQTLLETAGVSEEDVTVLYIVIWQPFKCGFRRHRPDPPVPAKLGPGHRQRLPDWRFRHFAEPQKEIPCPKNCRGIHPYQPGGAIPNSTSTIWSR